VTLEVRRPFQNEFDVRATVSLRTKCEPVPPIRRTVGSVQWEQMLRSRSKLRRTTPQRNRGQAVVGAAGTKVLVWDGFTEEGAFAAQFPSAPTRVIGSLMNGLLNADGSVPVTQHLATAVGGVFRELSGKWWLVLLYD
jgi:hypothetical protein